MRTTILLATLAAFMVSGCAAKLPGVASTSTPAAETVKSPPPAGAAVVPAPAAVRDNTSVETATNAPRPVSMGRVSASFVPLQGSKVSGTVRFTQKGSKVNVAGEVFGLTPGPHGFHIHEVGDCSAPDGASAKGHFNPANKAHGAQMGEHHGGDLGNINADASGMANLNLDVDGITLTAGPTGIISRSVIVHAGPDDLKTQPAGNSGKPIACGIIVQK
jgi:superoxide dismutase, Cu-Zn family